MILVTGGTGFIGSYIIRQLVSTGHRVRAIRRASSKLPFYIPEDILSQVEWVEADVLDLDALDIAMDGVDSIIHAAAIVSFQKRHREEMYKINVEGTANLVNLALDKSIRRFVHISSVAALGRTQNGETVSEKKQWQESDTNTHYAISKFKAEMEVWRASAEGLPVIVLNPSTVLGYGDWNTTSCALFKTVYKEFPYYTTGVNGFVYVQDVAEVTLRLLNSNIINERFIINGENWSFRQLFNTIADGFKTQRPKIHASPFLSSIAWRAEKVKAFFTGSPSLLSKETAKIAQTKTYFETAKLLNFLQDFSFTPLEEAVRRSCEMYLAGQVHSISQIKHYSHE
jgi:nucleoside-diphosphate-sugar epimerase